MSKALTNRVLTSLNYMGKYPQMVARTREGFLLSVATYMSVVGVNSRPFLMRFLCNNTVACVDPGGTFTDEFNSRSLGTACGIPRRPRLPTETATSASLWRPPLRRRRQNCLVPPSMTFVAMGL